MARALSATGGNKTHAAHILGLSVRQLRRLLNKQRPANRCHSSGSGPQADQRHA
ncbi:MAG: helix-turn-helix domain-containing protein [Planctomycetota bacterium]